MKRKELAILDWVVKVILKVPRISKLLSGLF